MTRSKDTDFTSQERPSAPGKCLTIHCVKTASQLLESMDSTVDPCDNFYQYACGNWIKKNVIPDDKYSYNTFEKLHDELQLTLKVLIEDPIKPYDSNATLKTKILYKSCVNICERICPMGLLFSCLAQKEAVGDSPIKRVLKELGGWPVVDPNWDRSKFNLEDILGDIRGIYDTEILVDTDIGPDDKNSSINVIQLEEPSLGMPSREYYLHDEDSPDLKAYLRYMCDVATLLGAENSTVQEQMSKALKFETMLANVSTPQRRKHDTGARYKKMTIKNLQQSVPEFDWLRYFNRILPEKVDSSEELVVFAEDFLAKMVKIVKNTDKRVISNFVLWRLILKFMPDMPEQYLEVRNEYRRVLQGVMRDKPWRNYCVESLNERLGIATGAMFVHEKFRKESKATALEMIGNLRAAFNDLLEENNWMDNETRAVAREKANAIKERIGYPEFVLDPTKLDKKLETLKFDPDQYFENILNVKRFEANKTMAMFRKPVNKEIWETDAAVVNAFYNPNTNDIVFPAGMLQPPFYSEYFPKSLNYGGIGVVIGHEITHGFDDKASFNDYIGNHVSCYNNGTAVWDQMHSMFDFGDSMAMLYSPTGRQYDKDGNMKQWWKNGTIEAFRHRTECIIDQYSNVKLEQIDKNIDGKNTQGENIADNGGLKQAFRAYKMWEKIHGPEPLLPGVDLSHYQLFFLNFAQIWCGSLRDKAALEKIRTSVHSPGPVRATVPLTNSEDFAEAFSCSVGSRMNPHHKCSVW